MPNNDQDAATTLVLYAKYGLNGYSRFLTKNTAVYFNERVAYKLKVKRAFRVVLS